MAFPQIATGNIELPHMLPTEIILMMAIWHQIQNTSAQSGLSNTQPAQQESFATSFSKL